MKALLILSFIFACINALAGRPSFTPRSTVVLECGDNAPLIVEIDQQRYLENANGSLEELRAIGDTVEASENFYLIIENGIATLSPKGENPQNLTCVSPTAAQ